MAALVEGRKLKLTLVSAKNLPVVRKFGQMKVYAVVSFNGNTKITGADMAGETNPTWNFVAGYTVDEVAVQLPGASILVKLWCERSLVGDRLIGEVKIGVKNLFESQGKILRYRVAGTPDGVLNISCSFGPKMAVSVPRPDAAALPQSPSLGKKVLNIAMRLGLGLFLADDLFNGDDHASHAHDQNDQEDGGSCNLYDDEGDDEEDGGPANDDQDDEDDDKDG